MYTLYVNVFNKANPLQHAGSSENSKNEHIPRIEASHNVAVISIIIKTVLYENHNKRLGFIYTTIFKKLF